MGNGPLSYCDRPGQDANPGADPLMQAIMICGDHDLNMDRLKDDIIFHEPAELKMEHLEGLSYGSNHRALRPVPEEPRHQKLEALIRQLFNLQDLNHSIIEEADLASLSDRIARIRPGKGFNFAAIRNTGRALFRERLDAFGRPVPYPVFRKCVLRILAEYGRIRRRNQWNLHW
jgi:hypothetical protein